MNAPANLEKSARSDAVYEANLRDPNEVSRIEAFVAGHKDASPFHRPLWLKAIEQGTQNRAAGLVLERGQEIAAWLPLTIVHSPLFGRALVSSGFGVEGGPLAALDSDAVTLCIAAEELARRSAIASVELRGGTAPSTWEVTTDSHCGFISDLAEDDEAQLLAIPRKSRAEVRKGLKQDLTVSIGADAQNRADHYAVYAESVRNLGTPVFPKSLFDSVLDAFGDDADILTVSENGTPISSVLSLYHNGAVMPYWGGGTFAARRLRANERMYYELMCHARQNKGASRFDFGRSKTGSGPYNFKKNWGFEPQPLAYAKWSAEGVEARNIDPTDAKYSARIDMWKRLPLNIANRIGPFIARGLG